VIGYEGQYVFSFNLGGKRDFISEPELTSFIIIEKAGFGLPTFELEFSTDDETIMPKLHEGQPLSVQFGANRDDLTEANLIINNFPILKENLTERTYILSGFISNIGYMKDIKNFISSPMSGIEAARIKIEESNFKFISNITKSEDSQRWIQSREPNQSFIQRCILHSSARDNSFFASAITADSKFKVIDVIKYLRERVNNRDYDWRFTPKVKELTDVFYDDSFTIESRAGVVAAMYAYGREKIQYNIENGERRLILNKPRNILSLSRDVPISPEVSKMNSTLGIINDNVHANYHQAYNYNLTNLMALSSLVLTLSIPNNRFINISPLQKVMFKDVNLGLEGQASSSEFNSGLYLVTAVSRELKQKRFTTTIDICRESFNDVRLG
jgi:hypothetical protein